MHREATDASSQPPPSPARARSARILTGGAIGLLLALAGLAGFVRDFSKDFHWHLAVGGEILARHAIYRVDTFSHTMLGRPMFVSSWLGDLLLAAAYAAGGYAGCYALRAACMGALFFLLLREMIRRGLSVTTTVALLLFLLAWQLFFFYLRPELFALLAFAALLHWLGEQERGRATRPPWAALGLIVLWANLHGSVGVGVLAFCLFSVERGAIALRGRGRWWGYLALPPLAFAAACVNPEGIGLPLAFRVLSPTWVAHTMEWAPLPIAGDPTLQLAGLVVAVSTIAAGRRASPWRAVLVLLLALMTLRYQRFLRYTLIAAAPLLAGNLAALASRLEGTARARRWRLASGALAALLAASALSTLFFERRLLAQVGTGMDRGVYPEAACRFARDHRPRGRMFNSYDFGSYLMFCLPGEPVWIDQRA
ncbi:MAG: hypothetical protein EXR72_17745 [Myxococcales bacterium]|nr:hypothetical protein [Myxococcales bacterium]